MSLSVCGVVTALAALLIEAVSAFQVALQPSSSTCYARNALAFQRSSFSVPASRLLRGTCRTTALHAAASAFEQSITAPACPGDGVALVVFTGAGDLRVHDHGGLYAAASARELHCVAVLDTDLLASMPDSRIRTLVSAIHDLGSSLHSLGLSLEVRVGQAGEEAGAAAARAAATHVYLHADPEATAEDAMQQMANSAAARNENLQVHRWNAALRRGEAVASSDDFFEYRRALAQPNTRTNQPYPSRQLLVERLQRQRSFSSPSSSSSPSAERIAKSSHLDFSALSAEEVIALARAAAKTLDPQRAPAYATANTLNTNVCHGSRELGQERDLLTETRALALWDLYKELGESAFARLELAPAASSPPASLDDVAARVYGVDGFAHGEAFLRVFSSAFWLGCLSPRVVWHDCESVMTLELGIEARSLSVA
jgi:hypothetical protein